MASKSKGIVSVSEMAVAERPSFMPEPNSNRGSENVGFGDLALPRLQIVQDLSPQHKKNKPEYIEGAQIGDLFNTVTNELYGRETLLVPVYYALEWLVWRQRDAGGGLVHVADTKEEAVEFYSQSDEQSQLEILDTAQHYCLRIDPNSPMDNPRMEEIVVSMAKSGLKASRTWNSQIKIAGGDRWERLYKVGTIEADGRKGEYWTWRIAQQGFVTEPIYRAAEKLYEVICLGQRSVDYTEVRESEPAGEV